jgi:ketosteroid isomerase-like protein
MGSQVLEPVEKQSADVQVVMRMYEAFAQGNIPGLMALLDPACTVSQSTALPWGGEYVGPNGVLEFLGKLTGQIASAVTTERYIDDGAGHVVASGVTRGHVHATGREFAVAETHVLTIRDGKILRFEAYIDTAAMLEALGVS